MQGGDLLLRGLLPRHGPDAQVVWLAVSGRCGFEIVQKAIVVGIPLLAAVGAPSSLAAQLARRGGMVLVGFLRNGRFNRYR